MLAMRKVRTAGTLSLPGKNERRFESPLGEIAQGECSAMRLRYVPRDAQSEAGAASVSIARRLHPVKGLEDAFQLIRGHTGPFVRDADDDGRAILQAHLRPGPE